MYMIMHESSYARFATTMHHLLLLCIITTTLLCLCRADVNTTDNFLWTPLHHACHTGEVNDSFNMYCMVVKLLSKSVTGCRTWCSTLVL